MTLAKRCSPVSGSPTNAATDSARSEMYGNGWLGSTANGVSTGKTRSSYTSLIALRSATLRSLQRAMTMPAAPRAGMSESRKIVSCRSTSRLVVALISASCCDAVRPSGVGSSMRAATWSFNAATRTWKNSSRLDEAMAQNLTRSRSGTPTSVASSRTRSSNASQLSSRLMNRSSTISP